MDEPIKKLLLVEDDALIAMSHKMQLEKIGYVVDHVLTGEAAIMAVRNANSRPDLILMDIDLGKGIDGTQAAEQILTEIDTPVVFLSSYTDPEIVEKTEKITFHGYVVKNSGLTVLDASIKMAFKLFEARVREQRHKADLLHSREQERQFKVIFENALNPILIADDAGNYLKANEAAASMFHCPVEQMIGMNVGDLQTVASPQARDRYQEYLKRGYDVGEFEFVRPDGSQVTAQYHAIKVRDNFNVSILSDITERKRAEHEIQRQLADKETLFKEVHHRIKNNMAQIESLLSIQAASAESADVKSALETAMSRVCSIRVLYEKLLVGTGHEEVSVKDYLESLIESHKAVYNDHENISIETSIDDFAVSTKKAIPIGIIVNELLTNVFKYAFGGRAEGHVRIGLDKDGKQVTLTVQDNGVGFDLRVTANKSTGFGLTLTKMLAEQLDGTFITEHDNGTKSVVAFEV
ncbi:MAG TPA: histidine kinase dimerization/phosphoacceptor domain -containing protein [Alkalispirochaeta sp.]|nr:histidine kinase dimerization/phosphoacceptor domain -containing protein [Alkalispirochaeta sp.]